MRLPSSVSIVVGVALVACTDGGSGGWETWDGATGTETDTDTDESTGTDESTDTGTDESTDTGTDEPYEGLRYLVTVTDDALVLGIDLDDPLDVPEPAEVITGAVPTGLRGLTPFDTQIITHDGRVDQLQLTSAGDYDFAPLATQDANWMDRVFFGGGGANAVMSVGPEAFGITQQLLWIEYDAEGQVAGSENITPPIEANGAVLVLDRSPDSRYAAVLVDAELDSIWQLYALNLDPEPNFATYIDQIDLTGLPPTSAGDFIWLHLDNQRITYRKEGQPGIFRPLAVALDDPDTNRVNLTPALGHISSMVWSPDHTRVLVTTGGGNGYRELWLVELTGPTTPQPPILISEPGKLAQVDTQVTVDFATLGHGFDELGRIWYAYADSLADPTSVGINLVVVVEGEIIQRVDLTETAPGLEIDDVVFDADLQLLGYRAQTANTSAIHVVDLSQALTTAIRIDQDFEHATGVPSDSANFAWSVDGRRIAVVGVQNSMTALHVADLADPSGATVEITLPDVESAQGITLDHEPRISPDGEQVILWYSVQDGRTGLVHAPTDGSAEGQVVLGLEHVLRDGTYLQYSPD